MGEVELGWSVCVMGSSASVNGCHQDQPGPSQAPYKVHGQVSAWPSKQRQVGTLQDTSLMAKEEGSGRSSQGQTQCVGAGIRGLVCAHVEGAVPGTGGPEHSKGTCGV
jgi:hypothetical protein